MVTTVDTDGAHGPARRRLEYAVHALASPRPQWVSGAAHWEPALYDRLRTALHYGPRVERKARGRSTLAPCRTDVLTVLLDGDATVRTWTPDVVKGGTVDRLHELAGRGWRPQDVATIERHCGDLQRWTIAATDLLVPPVRVYLPQPCPHCGARHAYRQISSGEHLRSRALKVSEDGCRHLACGAEWAPEQLHFLARLLGCEPLPVAAVFSKESARASKS